MCVFVITANAQKLKLPTFFNENKVSAPNVAKALEKSEFLAKKGKFAGGKMNITSAIDQSIEIGLPKVCKYFKSDNKKVQISSSLRGNKWHRVELFKDNKTNIIIQL